MTSFGVLRDGGPGYWVYGDGAGWDESRFGLPLFPEYLVSSAVNKALLALKDEKVNLSVAFFERKETADLAVNAAQKCVSLIEAFANRHKLSKRALSSMTASSLKKRNTKKLLNEFLQVQYGVRPLMQDVYGSAAALHQKDSGGRHYRATVFGRARESIDENWFKPSAIYSTVGYPCTVTGAHQCFVRLDYVMDNPFLASLASLGITNPASLIWEKIPFSFVADWFLPVGGYLSAWDAAVGWEFLAGTITRVSKDVVRSETAVIRNDPGYSLITLSNEPYAETNYRFRREVLLASPSPRVPSFKNPLSGQHVANAIALIAARLR